MGAVSSVAGCVFCVYEQSENKATIELYKCRKGVGMNAGLLETLFFHFGLAPVTKWNFLMHLPNKRAEVENEHEIF